MTLALSSQFPLLDIMATMLVAFGLVLFFYTLYVVFRDLFFRDDISGWGKTAWLLFVLVLPLIGSLSYLISQSAAMGKRMLARDNATHLRMDSYLHSAAGADGYRGVADVTRTRQAWSGPIRPA